MYLEEVEIRVDSLEALLGSFIVETRSSLNRLSKEMKEFKDEMKDFKDEMKDFKDEMKEFKDEMKDFKDEMKDFKDEMKEFKDEMKEYKKESERDRRNMNKQWGELANKMGTIVEDIVSPAVRPVLEKYFGCEIMNTSIHNRRKNKALNLQAEFDVVAVSNETVFLIEVKSSPNIEYTNQFLENIERFKILCPEYQTLKLVPIFASLRFDEQVVNYATSKNIYVMAYREWDYMDLLNFEQIK